MLNNGKPTTTTITVFARHSADCAQTNPQWKRCKCRKSLYIYEDGKVRYISARTRSWEQAETLAHAERVLRDPVNIRLRQIEEAESAKVAEIEAARVAKAASAISITDALDRWIASRNDPALATSRAYRGTAIKVRKWAEREKIVNLCDVTPNALDKWRGEWSLTATRKEDRIGPQTQSHTLTRIKGFFNYAVRVEMIPSNPASLLESITVTQKPTMPLTPRQYQELLAATAEYDAHQVREMEKLGGEMRVLFLVMRWTGLRIRDALMLPRSALQGNRVRLTTQKTKADVSALIPDEVVSAMNNLRPVSKVHPDYFFWSRTCTHQALTSAVCKRIKTLNKYLSFKDEHGKPMKFHSHMLRDTFAVEMLLAGVALEDVSKLLTHKSISVTEKYYAPWVKSRRAQLDDEVVGAMRRMGVTVTL